MCGIIGYRGQRKASIILLEGLKRLEYRGYDSVGIATLNNAGITVKKDIGKIEEAAKKLEFDKINGTIGIAHTRWSTHGAVTKENAHPHLSNNGRIAVVHNGIIENYQELRAFLETKGYKFKSETDSEVIPVLIEHHLNTKKDIISAFRMALSELKGSYALAMILENDQRVFFARENSPLVIGLSSSNRNSAGNESGNGNRNENEFFIASDVPAFLEHTNKVIYLDDNEYGYINKEPNIFTITTNERKNKSIETIGWSAEEAQKQNYPHFMIKEINEQAETVKRAIEQPAATIKKATEDIKNAFGVFLVGCGTSYHACVSATYQFSHIAHKHINVAVASEFRNYEEFLTNKTLIIAVSQSGETADLLDAVKTAKKKNSKIISIVNVMGSTLQRISDLSIIMHSGPEICVVSTKSYTAQLSILLLLAYSTAGRLEEGKNLILKASEHIPEIIEQNTKKIDELAEKTKNANSYFLIGRDLAYPSALEGALKLKETAYIHAEGFAGGELKHGTIALIEKNSPTIVLSTAATKELTRSNAEEIKARGGYIIGIGQEPDRIYDFFIQTPELGQANPIGMIVAIQLLAYYLAVKRGCDVDRPRNLAKCVTVK